MREPSFTAVEAAAHEGAFGENTLPRPTDAQCEAGNYRKGRVTLHGLRIAIEQPRGSTREGTDPNGTRWRCRLAAHYGYFVGTTGADGDGVDVFIGPNTDADTAYVINQSIAGRFDEHKVVLGAVDEQHARDLYRASYARGWRGLDSVVALSIPQLQRWLRHGSKRRALTADQLNTQGNPPMNRVFWNRDAQPEGLSLDRVLYHVRAEDGSDNLLLDAVCMDDIMEDSEGVIALDAMVVPVNLLARRMDVLKAVMGRTGSEVKPLSVQLSEPFKQRGTTNVAALFELSDGQTVTIYFHNPDTTPSKLAPSDELVSWKWLLNKKDITIVVAPERGTDLQPREVARRIMRLAEKNSAAFARFNAKRAERMGAIQNLKDEVADLENELVRAQRELEAEQILADERAQAAHATKVADAKAAADAKFFTPESFASTPEKFAADVREFGPGDVVADWTLLRVPAIAPSGVPAVPEHYRLATAERSVSAFRTDAEARAWAEANPIGATIDPATPEGYATIFAGGTEELERWQDALDPVFQSRIVDTRNALREMGWSGEQGGALSKGGVTLSVELLHVGAGRNVAGVTYRAAGLDLFNIRDSLRDTPEQLAGDIDAAAAAHVAAAEPAAEPAAAAPTSEYQLPEGDIYAEWAGSKVRGYVPTARQQVAINAVAQALSEGVFYSRDVDKRVAELLNVPPEVVASKRTNVEGGDFGYDLYYARDYLRAQEKYKAEDDASARLNLSVGDVVGTLMANYKRVTGCAVIAINGGQITLRGKMGKNTVELTVNARQIEAAISGAHSRGWRKDDVEAFAAARAAAAGSAELSDADKIAAVDAAYVFDNASDEFKLWVYDSIGKQDYSPFMSSRLIDMASKAYGAHAEWGSFDLALDAAMDDATAEESTRAAMANATPVAIAASKKLLQYFRDFIRSDAELATIPAAVKGLPELLNTGYGDKMDKADAVIALDKLIDVAINRKAGIELTPKQEARFADFQHDARVIEEYLKGRIRRRGTNVLRTPEMKARFPQIDNQMAYDSAIIADALALADGVMDSVALDDASHAVATLLNALEAVETNEPINRAEGNVEQADLERAASASFREALVKLGSPAPEPIAVLDAADGESDAADDGEEFDEDAEWEATPDDEEEQDEQPALDGDFAGHPFRGNQHRKGSRTSGTAVSASIHAKRVSRGGSEREVRTAHRIAHHSHVAASLAVTTGNARRYHRKMARLHAKHAGVEAALDDVGTLDAATVALGGRIVKDGEVVGRVDIGDDGKAMVYVGATGTQRVTFVSERDGERRPAMYSDDDAGELVEWLFENIRIAAAPDGEGEQENNVAQLIEAVNQNRVAKLATSDYFTVDLEGDDVLFSDDMRAAVEASIGEPLVEAVLPGLEAQVTLVPESKRPAPAEKLDPIREGVKKTLSNIVDGTTDPLTVDLDRLEKIAEDYEGDEELAPLIEQAVTVVVNAEDAATATL
jgi:hypothetical protein